MGNPRHSAPAMASLLRALPPWHYCLGNAAMFIPPMGIAAVATTMGIVTVASLPCDIAAVDLTSVAIAAVALPPCLKP